MIKHCFYINLEKRVDRKKFIEDELNKSKHLRDIYKRFDAVNGYEIHPRSVREGLLSENSINDILMDTITAWGLSLTQGGLGVLLSYIKLFELIETLDSPAITFEDDVVLDDNFDSQLENILSELPSDFDFCYLGYGDTKIEREFYSTNLSTPKGMITCLPSLIISPKGAKRLLETLKNIDNQIDTAIYTKCKNLNVFVSNEVIVKVKNSFTTDIQGNNSCRKDYKKQNYIISTIAVGDNANKNALKLCCDLNYFKQKILVVTDKKELYEQLPNVIVSEYTEKRFSYNHKIFCFEEGFKIEDCVVYIDSDSRIFYNDYKSCYSNFLRIIEPGFHPSWNWGNVSREGGGFFNSTDISVRVKGYGELALKLSKDLDIPIEDSFHYQEGIIIICKDGGREKVLLDTWKSLSKVLDEYEISNNSSRIGLGEGNLIGLSISKSNIKVNSNDVSNYIGDNLKYNFCSGGQINDYLKNYPGRKTVKIGDGILLKSNKMDIDFKNTTVDLSYTIHEMNDNLIILTFDWNQDNRVEFLDHEFKVHDVVYHFNSEKSGELIFEKKRNTKIYHTYDWYGERDWLLIDSI